MDQSDDSESELQDDEETSSIQGSEAEILKETSTFQPSVRFTVMVRELEMKSFRNVKLAHNFADYWDIGEKRRP